MQAREKFQANMLNVLSAVTHLLAAPVVPEATDTVRTALREERARWRAQVDEATKYLTDHAVQLLFAYTGSRLPDLAVRYSSNARGVWILDRTEEQKLTTCRTSPGTATLCSSTAPCTPVSASVPGRSWNDS